jgi:multidrug efflux system outer membrane protein
MRVGIFIIAFLYSIIGFAEGDYLKAASGHYEGTLTAHIGTKFSQVPVSADLSADKEGMKTILLKDQSGQPLISFHIDQLKDKYFALSGPLIEGSVRVNKDKDNLCFRNGVGQTVDFCFYRDLINVDVTDKDQNPLFSLSLNKFAVEKPIVVETPKAFTLEEAINRAWKLNFDNRIEFEHIIQAKFNAKAAKLNLLPHISFGSVLAGLTSLTFLNMMASAGDLVPFLFPTRWLQAKKAGQLNEAELDAMTLMRLDTAAQVEGLFYNFENDRSIKELYSDTLVKAKAARAEVWAREQLGLYPVGSTDNADSIINFLEQSYSIIEALLVEDKASIAQVMGFYNPNAVADATIGEEISPITKASTLDSDIVSKTAIGRSVELRQLDFLITAAKDNKRTVVWNWLDPAGDPTMNLGFNLKSNVNVAASQIYELQIRRNEMSQNIGQRALDAVTDYNQALKSYSIAVEGQAIQKRRLAQINNLLLTTGKIDLFNLVSVFQDFLTAGVNAQTNVLSYRMARTRVDRLLLQGNYINGTKPPVITRNP